mgnify:CR=1 FL=1
MPLDAAAAGPAAIAALRFRLPAGSTARRLQLRSGQGRRIVISQRQNWVWLLGPKGGVAAQGPMVDNPSVLHHGSYAVGSYCGRAARIKLNQSTSGDVWLDNFVRFAPCGIGFHRIPRHRHPIPLTAP